DAVVGATGRGAVTLTGQAPGDTPAITFIGVSDFGTGKGSLQAGTGDVTLSGDVIDLGDPGSVSTTGHARLFFQPFTASRPIQVGGTSDEPGKLTFTQADADASAQASSGFSHVTIGRPDGTGGVVAFGMTFDTSVTIESPGPDSAAVAVSG